MFKRYLPGLAAGFVAMLAAAPLSVTAAQGVQLRDTVETIVPARIPLLSAALSATIVAKEAEAAAAKAIADAEAATRKELERLRELEKNFQTFRFGVSLGWRHNVSKSVVREVSINPANNFVVMDSIDRGAFILSGVVAAHPWRNRELLAAKDAAKKQNPWQWALSNMWRLGFLANLNVAEFSPSSVNTFNKSLEGGLGWTIKLNEEFAFAATTERRFGRRARSFVKAGEPLRNGSGEVVTSLNLDDNTYFRDDNMTTVSFKFVYYIK